MMSSGSKRVILGFDAVRALLFRDHEHQAEFVAELEVASSYGYVPLYPAMTLSALDASFIEAKEQQLRRRLAEIVFKLDKGSYIGLPDNDEWTGAFQLQHENHKAAQVEFADFIALTMAIRRDAAVLTKDESFISLIARSAPAVLMPPFRQTLGKATGEAKPM